MSNNWQKSTGQSPELRYTGTSELDLAIENSRRAGKQVEVVLVIVSHQPFGLLMSQVSNIVRPQSENIQVLSSSTDDQPWAEIEYQFGRLRVLELARMLHMPLAQPIARSKILLTGNIEANGKVKKAFGVAIDDILSIKSIPMDDLRLLPTWMCSKRLGRLIWAVALIDRVMLTQQSDEQESHSEDTVSANELADFMSEVLSAGGDSASLQAFLPPSEIRTPSLSRTNFSSLNNELVKLSPAEPRRPVVLLDLDALKSIAHNHHEG